jgi:hypothetical protein
MTILMRTQSRRSLDIRLELQMHPISYCKHAFRAALISLPLSGGPEYGAEGRSPQVLEFIGPNSSHVIQ